MAAFVSLPTDAFKAGDFSGYRDGAGAMIPVFDPATTTADGTRTPFAGQHHSRQPLLHGGQKRYPPDPQTGLRGLLQQLPQPHRQSRKRLLLGHQGRPYPDHQSALSVALWRSSTYTPSYSPLGPSTPIGFWGFNPVTGFALRASYDYTIRPNLLHHFGFGYTASNPIRQRDDRHGNDIYKLPGLAADSPGFPVFNVSQHLRKSRSWAIPTSSQTTRPRTATSLHRQHHLDQRPPPAEGSASIFGSSSTTTSPER